MTNEPFTHKDALALKELLLSQHDGMKLEVVALSKIVDEKEKLYSQQFKSSETAVNAALMAQQLAVKDAFLASEKAIVKAEDAQRDYNYRSNNFRTQLDDQAKTLMPRLETAVLLKSIEGEIDALKINIDGQLAAFRTANQKEFESVAMDIKSLRESRAGGTGKETQQAVNIAYLISAVFIIIGIMSFVVTVMR